MYNYDVFYVHNCDVGLTIHYILQTFGIFANKFITTYLSKHRIALTTILGC